MRKLPGLLIMLTLLWIAGDARPLSDQSAQRANSNPGFPQTVRVRLWYLHPPSKLRVSATAAGAQISKCRMCKPAGISSLEVRASGSSMMFAGDSSALSEARISGAYQITATGAPPIHADFPVELRADDGHLLVTALMPMEEYVAGVLAGETGNFKSDEALKAMAVAARTYAVHFGSRHALDNFDFCDTTHCQDLRIAGIDARLRRLAESTAGEVLWFDGEPAATYYYANCGGRTEDGHYILGNDEEPAPYLMQHSDRYCVRNSSAQWSSQISKRDLQRALADEGINIPGKLRSVSILHRTPSGRVEFLRVIGAGEVTVSGLVFRSAVGRHIGWDKLKSNLYDISDRGEQIAFHGRGFGHGVGLCQVGAEVMGEEGHSYREILRFYYPGTRLGVAAQGIGWQQLANEDIELLTPRPERDRSLLPIATRYLHETEESTGLMFRVRPRLKIYATVAEFRNSTGEPGWIAASTRGRTIQMQPTDVLRDAGTLDSTVHHELLHMLIDSYARPGTPLWLREGLVLYLTAPKSTPPSTSIEDVASLEKSLRAPQSEAELRKAYAEAGARVAQLAEQHGKETLLNWVQNGVPPEFSGTLQQTGAH